MNCATARSTDTSSSVCTCVVAARLPALRLVEPRVERVERRRHADRQVLEAEPPPRGAAPLVREQHLEAHDAARRAPSRRRRTRASSAFATPCRRARGRTWTRCTCALPRVGASTRATPTGPCVVLGEEDAAAADVVARCPPTPPPTSPGSPTGLGHLALELLPELAQDRLVGLGRAADRHGGQRRPSGGSGPTGSGTGRGAGRARAPRHRRDLGRLAQHEVAGGPRARAGEVAGEEPFGRPRAEPAQRRDARAHLVVVRAPRARRGRARCARAPTAYSALRRVKPTAKSSSSSRGGDPLARRERPRARRPARRSARSAGSGSRPPRRATPAAR